MELTIRGGSNPPPGSKVNVKEMYEKILSVCLGSFTGFVSAIVTDKLVDVLILSFIGGVIGWFGGRAARWIDKNCRCYFTKKEIMERLWKQGKKTTILGLIILMVALFMLYTGKLTGSEFALLMPFILVLLRVKDTFLKASDNTTSDINKSTDA